MPGYAVFMSNLPFTERITPRDVRRYKHLRLGALRDAPYAFSTSYHQALERDEASWKELAKNASKGPEACIYFLRQGQTDIGLGGVFTHAYEEAIVAEIMQIWIAPQSRGTRAIHVLMASLHEWCRACGYASILATVHVENPRALAYYQKIGYVIDEERTANAPARDIILTKTLF